MLSTPRFHHLHLSSVGPEAAIDFYTRQFPSSSRTEWADEPALASPNNVLVLFTKVATPPATAPETAIWHSAGTSPARASRSWPSLELHGTSD